MKYWTVPVALAMLAGALQPAYAKSNKGENMGVGVGAIVGAAAGGPVGFLVGVIGGAKIGERIDDQNDQAAELSQALAASQGFQAELQRDIFALERNIETVKVAYTDLRDGRFADLQSLLEDGLELSVLFAPDTFEPGDDTRMQLTQLGEALKRIPDARIALHGFADSTGGDRYNQLLSRQRAMAVRDILQSAGVESEAMQISAHGRTELTAVETRQDRAEDRRVTLMISLVSDVEAAVAGL